MNQYVALGSVVLLKGGTQKLLVIARAITVKNAEKTFFFDYGGVLYPEGLMDDKMAYFNKEDVSKVVFEGYSDIEDENILETIETYLLENPNIIKGNAENWE